MIQAILDLPIGRQLRGKSLSLLLAMAALVFFLVCLAAPLSGVLVKSLQDGQGGFVALANFQAYANTPALFQSIRNSLAIAATCTLLVTALAFLYAYGITRTCMPGKALFRLLAQAPILAPSLMPAISLVYFFGNQGLINDWLLGESIYGPIGIVMGLAFWTFPHALLILTTALSNSDQRLYEAADAMGAGHLRRFLTVTLPGIRYGLISAAIVVFTLVLTDFGVPKVIGGQYPMLATDIYKQVVGQQNFNMGSVVGVVLLVPSVLAFLLDRLVQRKQVSMMSTRAVPLVPKPSALRDGLFFLFCATTSLILIAVIGMAVYASLVQFWPYDLSLSLDNYRFDRVDGGGWQSYFNSIELGLLSALAGTILVFLIAYLVEKERGIRPARNLLHLMAYLPLAVPGMVLGLAYIFFFNNPHNPLHFMYGTMSILVLATVVHYYSVPHLTAITALKQIPDEFEDVAASLKTPLYRFFLTVTLPVSLPAILDIAAYLFVNAMTTVSAVVFLYSPDTTLASVAVLNMDDAGDIAPAAAMATMIFLTALVIRLVYGALTRGLRSNAERWREA